LIRMVHSVDEIADDMASLPVGNYYSLVIQYTATTD